MKNYVKIIIGVSIIFTLALSYAYWYIYSMQTFMDEKIPVLVTPDTSDTSDKPMSTNEYEEPNLTYFDEKQLPSFNVLILGIDKWANETSRTDLMMLINIDTKRKTVNVISIPRDTRVEIPNIGYTKINHAHMIGEAKEGNKGGTEMALQATSNLFQTEIHYYVKVDITGFKNFIDSIGGLDIELSHPVKLSHIDLTLPAQRQNIDGKITFELVRERYSLLDGDFGRQNNHYLVLKAIVYKLLSSEYLASLPELITTARNEVVDTNFTDKELISLAWLYKGIQKDNINYVQIPGSSEYFYDPLVKVNLYFWVPDMDKVNEIAETYLSSQN